MHIKNLEKRVKGTTSHESVVSEIITIDLKCLVIPALTVFIEAYTYFKILKIPTELHRNLYMYLHK